METSDFLDALWAQHRQDLTEHLTDNYDAVRFSYDGVDRSDSYDWLFQATQKDLADHGDAYARVYALLADPASRALYVDLLRYRMAGHKHVRLRNNTPAYRARFDPMPVPTTAPSDMGAESILGCPFQKYTLTFEGRPLVLDTLGIKWPFVYRQYFYDDAGVRIAPRAGDHIIDAGACWGDTALAFGAAAGMDGAVYLFEPLAEHLRMARHNIAQNPDLSRFVLFPYGLSDRASSGEGVGPAGVNPGFSLDEDAAVPTVTLDAMLEAGRIPRVDFIKMDIEGAEYAALLGSVQTLRRYRPRLAISLYHKPSDFRTIPLFLDDLKLGYRFHLDHYTIHAGETVLYACADQAP